MAADLLSKWTPYRELKCPPVERVRLWAERGCGVWVDNAWGPAVPYPAARHENGSENYGYVRIKGNSELASKIRETFDFPELATFLAIVNTAESPIESVGCEKSFSKTDGGGTPPVELGSYIDLLFTDMKLNDFGENTIRLACHFLQRVEGCERWWTSVSMVLQRFRGVPGTVLPWGLMLHVTAYGRDEAEARRFWGATLGRLGKAVQSLPNDFSNR
jgi:hypothetical protein